MKKTTILFVCMGNICRSPTAEGIARTLAERAGLGHRFEFDSAGTHDYHIGRPPDVRSQQAAAARGYDLSKLRARQVQQADFQRFDRLLAMDRDNLDLLRAACPPGLHDRLGLFLDYAPELGVREVPDPYYGGAEGFERVIDLVEAAVRGLLSRHASESGADEGQEPPAIADAIPNEFAMQDRKYPS